jgi:hypothetical protein
MGVRP